MIEKIKMKELFFEKSDLPAAVKVNIGFYRTSENKIFCDFERIQFQMKKLIFLQ